MQKLSNNEGFTLIEVLISIVIILIALNMLFLFLPGYKLIVNSGIKGEALYEAQKDITDEIVISGDDSGQLIISFQSQNITIDGEFVQINTNYENSDGSIENVQIDYFNPRVE